MKKLFALGFAVVLVLSLCSCGVGQRDEKDDFIRGMKWGMTQAEVERKEKAAFAYEWDSGIVWYYDSYYFVDDVYVGYYFNDEGKLQSVLYDIIDLETASEIAEMRESLTELLTSHWGESEIDEDGDPYWGSGRLGIYLYSYDWENDETGESGVYVRVEYTRH